MSVIKVMIVEDNTTVAKDLSGCLIDLGYEVTSIEASGEESVEKAGIDRPDIVLMDIRLRDKMTGIEAAELIYDKYNLPCVFLSAYSDRELMEKAKRVGAFGYLVKPFEERELFATIETAFYRSKAEAERRRLEARLARMQRQESLQVMAASIAHNFNNILQVPLGYFSLMKEVLSPDSQCHEYVDASKIAIDRAVRISQLMLVYVGHGQNEFENVDLTTEIQKGLAVFQDELPGQHVLKQTLADEATLISGDRGQLQDLLTALLTNATEAIGSETGEIRVTTRVVSAEDPELGETFKEDKIIANDFVMLSISDSGCGMDSETMAKLYDPFFSTKFTGRGLGLAMVQGVVKGHCGAVAAQSQSGQGTMMKIIFPLLTAPD